MTSLKSENSSDVTFTVSAPGKVILFGEHAVVYDKLAIAASLDLRTRLTFRESNSTNVNIVLQALNFNTSYDFKILERDILNKFLPLKVDTSDFNWENCNLIKHNELLQQVRNFVDGNNVSFNLEQHTSLCTLFYLLAGILQSVNIPIKPFTLKIETDLKIGAGTGSSASFSVTIVAALLHYIKLKAINLQLDNISKQEYKFSKLSSKNLTDFNQNELELISKWAFYAEKIIHGFPSGLDNTICTYGSVVQFYKSTGVKFIPQCQISLLLINTKVSRNTKSLVHNVLMLRDRHLEVINSILNSIDEVSKNALECFAMLGECQNSGIVTSTAWKNVYNKLSELSTINQGLLQALGVSHPTINDICEILQRFDLHGKLTGAGGGGCVISFIAPCFQKETINDVIDQLKIKGYEAVLTQLGGYGVTIDQHNAD